MPSDLDMLAAERIRRDMAEQGHIDFDEFVQELIDIRRGHHRLPLQANRKRFRQGRTAVANIAEDYLERDTVPQLFVIRAAYAPSVPIELNEYRLALTERYCVPSLRDQTLKGFSIELRVHPNDPLLDKRMAAFESVGVPVLTKHSPGRQVRTRFDDDDAIAADFVERLWSLWGDVVIDGWYSFPNGYVTDGHVAIPRHYPQNQFLTRVGERGVFELVHTDVKHPTIIDDRPAWIWVRHQHNRSPNAPDLSRGQPLSELAELFPCVSP
jgi:hypothetical protein